MFQPTQAQDHLDLSYTDAGAGKTLVLVHGGWSDRNNWAQVHSELAREFRVVAIDRRGHGLSKPLSGESRVDQENDLARLIESVGERATVIGTSFGGSIAIGLATRRPALVEAVIAHEPPLVSLVADDPEVQPLLQEVNLAIADVCDSIEDGRPADAAEHFVEKVALGPGAWATLPEPLRSTMIATAPAFRSEQRDPLWAHVEHAALAEIDVPVLLTQGTASPPLFEPIVSALAQLIPEAVVHTYESAGHAPHLTHPGDYVSVVTEFMSRKEVV
jgi:pimeloyl-ACP methyl ester carboxylesterase